MDKHLNIFYPYSSKEKNNIKEDNITRASLIVFDLMSNEEKIAFVNTLLKCNLLNPKNEYNFVVDLQNTDDGRGKRNLEFRLNPEYVSLTKKYLVGFCPDGKVEGCDSKTEAVEKIYSSPVNHEARADGIIRIEVNNKTIAIILFENKLRPLFPDQLKRHFDKILNIHHKDEIEKALVLYNYRDFFNLYQNVSGRIKQDLLELLNLSGYLQPKTFKEIESVRYNKKNNVESLLKNILIKASNEKMIRKQTGWGWTIDVSKTNKYIRMIGLVYKEKDDTVELCLKFAPTMRASIGFYKQCVFPRKEKINFSKFRCEIHLGHKRGYVEKSYIFINDSYHFVSFIETNMSRIKTSSLKETKQFIEDITKQTKTRLDKQYELDVYNDGRLKNGDIWIVPSFTYVKKWKLADLYNKNCEYLVDQVLSSIKECENQLDISIQIQ